MNKHYSDVCVKCHNAEECYIFKILGSSDDEFDSITLSECLDFVDNNEVE